MSASKRVLIVGGGVVGLCTAYYALEKGHRVTILERGGPDHDSCSLGNAGMIVPSHFVPLAAPGMVPLGLRMLWNPESPFTIRPRLDRDLLEWCWRFLRASNAGHVERSAPLLRDLNLASRCAFEELSERFGAAFELTQRGLLMLCKTERTLHDESHLAETAVRLGVPARVLNPRETAEIDPDIQMDVAGAVYFPKDCHLTPARFVARLTEAVVAGGAQFRWNDEVTGWQTEAGRIRAAQTAAGEEIVADEFVLAAGSWSPELTRELRLRLPMQAGKGYSVTLPRPRRLPRLCSILTEARVAVTPMGETLRFGGTMEVTGCRDDSVAPARVRGIFRSIPNYFPEFGPADFQNLPVWRGLRPCSPDGLPYIGRFHRWANLSAATGHAMMGVSLAPITGKLMASVLSDEPTLLDITALRPDRFDHHG